MSAHVKINLTAPGRGTFEVNGNELPGVTAFKLEGTSKTYQQLTLDFAMMTGQVDGVMVVHVPDATRDALIALGWTPPDDVEFIRCDIDLVHGNCQRPDGHDGPCRVDLAAASSTTNDATEDE